MVRTFTAGGLLAVLAILLSSRSALTQDRSWKVDQTDRVFAEWHHTGSPGCAVGVIEDGALVFERGYGMANLDYDVPLTSQSVFYIASTSKQFAAASIALLALRGRLSLDDDVRRYVPELPAYDRPVTVRHLLHHTSGVRDYLALRSMAGKSFEDFFDMAWGVDIISRQERLNFEPGSEYLYSNSGYLLLAEIVGRVSGKPLPEFGRENFFQPLGMTATHWGGDRHRVVPDRVISYDAREPDGYRRWVKNFHAMGDGNLLTTVEDLAKWDAIFYDTTDAWRPLVDLMLTRGVLNDGEEIDYALGLMHGEYRDRPTVAHGGAFLGFRTEMMRFPEDRLTTIALCNFGSTNPSQYARRLADIWLFGDEGLVTEDREPSAASAAHITLPPATLATFPGVYRNPDSPVGDAVITLNDGDLTLEVGGATFRLAPTASTQFASVSGPVNLALHFAMDGAQPVVRITQSGAEGIEFTRSDAGPPSIAQLEEFAGSFYSRELDITYVVTLRDGGLHVKRPGSDESPLRVVGDDEFTTAGWSVTFTRDETETVTGFLLDAGRVRGLRFDKR